ncbi:spermidine synthase [Agromyces sp. Marseille-P2726]|uniref:spermidine synthase n=1 Tax=Agromyces sp. Marseille-P2726 TaxID=2709132 RepID=UPI001570344C|nr:fused MFS/spermidine synthase [Agromyces sp. Marseille-P2726]
MAPPRIEFEPDVFSKSGLTLLVEGTAQSHVDVDDPAHLFFEYVRRIGHVLDTVRGPGEPIRALHLGGGALTLPRYVAATRSGSSQVVVEHDAELVETVLDRLPLPAGAEIEVHVADARSALGQLTAEAPFDAVVVDLYTRLDAPAFVDQPSFMGGCLELAAADGLVVVNVADAPGLTRLRAQTRALAQADPDAELLVAGDPSVLSGVEEGNAILVAAHGGIPDRVAARLAAGGPFPVEVLTGHRLDAALWGAS